MDDEEGIDLSEVPVCVQCGLEVANKVEHENWHQLINGDFMDLQAKVDSLEGTIKSILTGLQASSGSTLNPTHKPYITDEEIRKYGEPKPHPYKTYKNLA